MYTADNEDLLAKLIELQKQTKELSKEEAKINDEVLRHKIANEEALQRRKLDNLTWFKKAQDDLINQAHKLGLSATKEEFEAKKAAIKQEYANDERLKKKKLKEVDKQEKAQDDAREKKEKKLKKQRFEDIKKEAQEMGLVGKAYEEAVKNAAKEAGLTDKEVKSLNKKSTKWAGNTKLVKAMSDTTFTGALLNVTSLLGDFASKLDGTIDSIGATKGAIDTRLQGSKSATKGGSYWDQISNDIKAVAAVSPLVKQSAIVDKIKTMVSQGISYNVEQRAFLATISEKIATTFNAADSTLLRLVRLQQQDSTAARLGMESAMTAFLNNMYETTEYMGAIADGIRSQLEEATALMSAEESIGFEYQVQKWMGSMYSVGMSQSGVNKIAETIGKIASGDISGITGNETGNLVIMAANNAGLNISEALQKGLDESSTNELMSAMVSYLAGIYDESQGNKVLQQQFANVYGLTASDLKAISNLRTSTSNIYNKSLNYNGAMQQLTNMAGSIGSRTSMGEMLSNMWDNVQYTLAQGIANSPLTYGLYKLGGMMDSLGLGKITGIKSFGTGFDTIDVAGIMRTGAMLGGLAKGVGSLISGIGNSFSGTSMLKQLGINSGITSVSRGTGAGLLNTSGASLSESGSYAVGGGATDAQNKALSDTQNQVASASADNDETTLSTINSSILLIEGIAKEINVLLKENSTGGAFRVELTGDMPSAWSQQMTHGGY